MKASLKIEIDTDQDSLILGGYFLALDDDETVHFYKVIGMYDAGVEGFDIVQKDLKILDKGDCTPAKITIDGFNVAKESYRIFVTNLDNEYEYITKTYKVKPTKGEQGVVIDMKLINTSIFSSLPDKDVTIGAYSKLHHNYSAITKGGIEIFLRRSQFTLKNDIVNIAFLKDINK